MTINLLGFIIMGWDKSLARARARRVPENSIFLLALAGGAAGIYLGIKLFRHKTQHIQFTIFIPIILAIQVGLLLWYQAL